MDRYRKLVGNSFVMSIGSFGSKLLTFVMVPLYTYKLSTNEYGITDLIQTLTNVLLPVAFLCIFDAVLRFAMEKNRSQKVLTNAFVLVTIASVIVLVAGTVCELFGIPYSIVTAVLVILQAIQLVMSQYAKAIDKIQLYALNGILLTFATVVLNLVFLVGLNLRLQGYIASLILANTLTIFHLAVRLRIWRQVSVALIDRNIIVEMLKFSTPLIPNSMAWWMTSTVNRWFVLSFIGTAANGIFAVANKLPSIISVLTSVFAQAWQLSAIEENKSQDKQRFYTQTFLYYSETLFIIGSGLLCILKPLLKYAISPDYFSAWQSAPFLILTVIYSSFAGFVGANFTASKNTKIIFTTTVVGMLVNVALNFILISKFELVGAGVSSAISFFCVWIVRQFRTTYDERVDIDWKKMLLTHIVIFSQIAVLFFTKTWGGFPILMVLTGCIGLINKDIIRVLLNVKKAR